MLLPQILTTLFLSYIFIQDVKDYAFYWFLPVGFVVGMYWLSGFLPWEDVLLNALLLGILIASVSLYTILRFKSYKILRFVAAGDWVFLICCLPFFKAEVLLTIWLTSLISSLGFCLIRGTKKAPLAGMMALSVIICIWI